MQREALFLSDMRVALDVVSGIVNGLDLDQFERNVIVRSAVAYQLQIVGEAANQLPGELRARYAAIPWRQIIDFRHVIVHHYFGIDWLQVWHAATVSAPELRAEIDAILAAEFPEE